MLKSKTFIFQKGFLKNIYLPTIHMYVCTLTKENVHVYENLCTRVFFIVDKREVDEELIFHTDIWNINYLLHGELYYANVFK